MSPIFTHYLIPPHACCCEQLVPPPLPMLIYSCRCRRCVHPPDLGPHAGGRPSKKDIGCVRVRQSAGSALRAVPAGGSRGQTEREEGEALILPHHPYPTAPPPHRQRSYNALSAGLRHHSAPLSLGRQVRRSVRAGEGAVQCARRQTLKAEFTCFTASLTPPLRRGCTARAFSPLLLTPPSCHRVAVCIPTALRGHTLSTETTTSHIQLEPSHLSKEAAGP